MNMNRLELARAELAKTLAGGDVAYDSGRAFLLDISSSMVGMKLEEAKRSLLKNARNNDLIITFGYETHVIPKDMVSSLFVDGDTAMLPAIEKAVAMKISHIILITDGWPNVGGDQFAIMEYVAHLSGIKIDTIGIGQDCDHMLLKNISKMCGGSNYKVDDPMQLNGIVGLLASPQQQINL